MAVENDIMSLLALADLTIAKGDYERSLSLLRDALGLAEKTAPGDLKLRLDIMMKLADVNHITGQWVDALMYLDNVLHTASEKNLVGIMGEALITSGTILSKKGKWDIAQRKFDQAIAHLGTRYRHPMMARAMIGTGIIFWRRGMGDEAIRNARKAFAIGDETENDEIMGAAQALVANAAFDMGNFQLSLDSNDKALNHYRRARNILEVTRVLNNTGETYKIMENYSKAIEYFNEGLKLTSGKGVRRNMGYLLTNLAECHIREGRRLEARTFATMAEDNIAGIQDEYLHSMLKFVWGLIYEFENDLGKASENFMSAILKMLSLGIPFDTGVMELAYSECLMKQGKTEEARMHLTDAIGAFRKADSKIMIERAEKKLAKIG
ncbi:MAG: tetratricopeptide repeat protein [Thermoplasmata archaeon]|nr:tetratricopeptide repeat protein [Thermoplasmata archaeon]